MIESFAKVLWILLSGAFIFGAWSGTHEFRIQTMGSQIESQENDLTTVKLDYQKDNRLMIEFMGRVDERLKSLERKIQ